MMEDYEHEFHDQIDHEKTWRETVKREITPRNRRLTNFNPPIKTT